MACYHPMRAFYGLEINPKTGKRPLVFKEDKTDPAWTELMVPCGQCIGCRLERSRQDAIRCVHEAQMHEANSFITLTFHPDWINPTGTLYKPDFQNFMKRLRDKLPPETVRFFHCGEYGDKLGRPHHHALIFGYDFPDRYLWKTHRKERYYRSPQLEKLWPFGHAVIGDVTFESAAYVARYIMKKQTGKNEEEYYGELLSPYTTRSLKPGIGRPWLEKYGNDVYPHDYVVIRNGVICRPPTYYDRLHQREFPDSMAEIKHKRAERGLENELEYRFERLIVKEELQLRKLNDLHRNYEINGIDYH